MSQSKALVRSPKVPESNDHKSKKRAVGKKNRWASLWMLVYRQKQRKIISTRSPKVKWPVFAQYYQTDEVSYSNSLSIVILKNVITWKDGYNKIVKGESRIPGCMCAVLHLYRKFA